MIPGRRFYLLAGLVLCAGAMICQGRVFFRRVDAANSTQAITLSGGKIAYEAEVIVNGGKGHLTVIGLDKSIADAVKDLSGMFKITDFNYHGGTIGFGSFSTDGQVTRLTVLRLGASQKTVVMKLDQSENDFNTSRKPPDRHMLKAVPAYPGSTPSFFASDENTQLSLAMSTASAPAGDIRSFYDSTLSAAGWTPMLTPADQPVQASGMGIYLKGQDICFILVDNTGEASETRITLLHKQQRIR